MEGDIPRTVVGWGRLHTGMKAKLFELINTRLLQKRKLQRKVVFILFLFFFLKKKNIFDLQCVIQYSVADVKPGVCAMSQYINQHSRWQLDDGLQLSARPLQLIGDGSAHVQCSAAVKHGGDLWWCQLSSGGGWYNQIFLKLFLSFKFYSEASQDHGITLNEKFCTIEELWEHDSYIYLFGLSVNILECLNLWFLKRFCFILKQV